jgi:hypothetical protein
VTIFFKSVSQYFSFPPFVGGFQMEPSDKRLSNIGISSSRHPDWHNTTTFSKVTGVTIQLAAW